MHFRPQIQNSLLLSIIYGNSVIFLFACKYALFYQQLNGLFPYAEDNTQEGITEIVMKYVPVFETIYNTHATDLVTWGQHPELADDSKNTNTYAKAIIATVEFSTLCTRGSWALEHYLLATGNDYSIDVRDLVKNSNCGRQQYEEYLRMLKQHVKSVLKDGDTICIVSKIPFSAHENGFPLDISSADWLLTLGAASGAFCVVASRAGDKYTISGSYYVADNYDFNKEDYDMSIIPTISNADMFYLHDAGMAKAYYMHGEMDLNDVFWNW